MLNMKRTIAELINQGMSAEDIHKEVDRVFQQEQKEKEIAAAREKAITAITDYIIAVWDERPTYPILYEDIGIELDNFAAKFGVSEEKQSVDMDSDEAIRKFLMDIGFHPVV